MVKENLEEVNRRISEACRRAGRNREDVTLIAVSKTKPVSMLEEAYETGIRDFGENKVQELCEKHEVLQSDIRWHMILLEVNVAEEESKYGFRLAETEEAMREIAAFPHVHIRGLMTIAPFVDNSEENRPIFKKLYQFYVDMRGKNIDNVTMSMLSMGMTGDYEVAIEEGATLVRVGTGIFGTRYKIGENEG